jgi:hypothetical protein
MSHSTDLSSVLNSGMSCSNLGRNTEILTEISSGLPQSLQETTSWDGFLYNTRTFLFHTIVEALGYKPEGRGFEA